MHISPSDEAKESQGLEQLLVQPLGQLEQPYAKEVADPAREAEAISFVEASGAQERLGRIEADERAALLAQLGLDGVEEALRQAGSELSWPCLTRD
jgi:hypothetical protein